MSHFSKTRDLMRKPIRSTAALAPATSSDRRGFIRPSILPRPTENDPAEWPQTCRCHPRLCEPAAAALPRWSSPRAVLIAWDTLETCPALYPAREISRLSERTRVRRRPARAALRCCRNSSPRAAFRMRKRRASRRMTFSRRLPRPRKERGGTVLIASGDRDTFQLASDRTTILYPVRGGATWRALDPAEVRARYDVEASTGSRILSHYVATHPTSSRVLKASVQWRGDAPAAYGTLEARSLLSCPTKAEDSDFSGRSPQ